MSPEAIQRRIASGAWRRLHCGVYAHPGAAPSWLAAHGRVPAYKIAIQTDATPHRSGRRAWQRDVGRQNALVARGWRVLRFTW